MMKQKFKMQNIFNTLHFTGMLYQAQMGHQQKTKTLKKRQDKKNVNRD